MTTPPEAGSAGPSTSMAELRVSSLAALRTLPGRAREPCYGYATSISSVMPGAPPRADSKALLVRWRWRPELGTLVATSRALAIWAGRPALPWSRYWTFRSRVGPLSLGRQRPAFESSLATNLD